MPGHADAGEAGGRIRGSAAFPASEYVSVEDARVVADYALEKGLAGVLTWDINRDAR